MSRKLSYPVDDDSSEVIKRYEQYLSGDAAGYFDVEELERIVEYYLSRGRTKDCSKALELGFQLHPDNNALKVKRAKIYLATGDVRKAMRVIDTVSVSNDYEVSLIRIEALLKMERLRESRAMADTLILGESADLANVCLDVAFIFIGEGDYETALFYLESGYKHDKRNTDLLFELAFCYEQTENYNLAIDTYSEILDIDSFSAEAWFNTGQLYYALQEFEKALEAYDFALAIEDKDSLSWLQKANAHFQLSQFREAIDAYKDYVELTGVDSGMAVFIAECYEKLEQFEEAILYYQQALDQSANNYDALTGIAICLLEMERFTDSMPYIEKALNVNPEAADAWVYLAEAYIGLDDTHNALIAYLKSISLEPEQPDTLMAIANICLEQDEYDTAIQYYRAAHTFDHELEFVELFMAVAFYKKGEFGESASLLEQAVKQNPLAAELFVELCPEVTNPDFGV